MSNEAKLKKLEIYVNASTIKALCEWKLNNYEEAQKTAKTTTDYMESRNITAADLPREFAVLHAMSALIGIETMNNLSKQFFSSDSVTTESGITEYERLIRKEANLTGNIEKDLEDLESIASQIDQDHEVQTYLIMSQLSAVKVWSDALSALRRVMKRNGTFTGNNRDWYDGEREALDAAKDKYANDLEDRIGKDHPVYQHWNFLLGFQNN